MKSYYDILEVSENASQEVIDKAYKALIRKYHPDLQPRDKIFWAESKIKEITEAYNVLSDSQLRSEYNLKIGVGSDILKQYSSLFSENEKLRQEIDNLKNKEDENSKTSQTPFNILKNKNKKNEKKEKTKKENINSEILKQINPKKYIKSIATLLYKETKKTKEERSKDLIAIVLTVLIVGMLIFISLKIPAIRNFLFPNF